MRASYDPKKGLDIEDVYMAENIVQPSNLAIFQGTPNPPLQIGASIENVHNKWGALVSKEKHLELHEALIHHITNN